MAACCRSTTSSISRRLSCATSRTRSTCSGTNKRWWGSTWPCSMKPRVFFAQRHGLLFFTSPHLVVHEAVQVPPSAGQALAEVVGSHLQDLATDGIAGAENLAEREDQP